MACTVLSTSAFSATVTDNLVVNATVVNSCSVTGDTLNFGNVDALTGTTVDVTATISVTCTLGTTYNVQLDQGTYGASVTTRKMQKAASTELLSYHLYTSVLNTTEWGVTNGVDTVAGTGLGIAATPHLVYGSIPAGQEVPAGSYSDTVTITVAY
ncbi:spore coat protein U domain-containing protein [Sinimarinibacterium sp. CAU 1509]|nr:spore coat protein U domain-containing protein [Sinimarinibacterium sp. CAU 1509]